MFYCLDLIQYLYHPYDRDVYLGTKVYKNLVRSSLIFRLYGLISVSYSRNFD